MQNNNTPEGDFTEQDGNDRNSYCKHGIFAGNPHGGDYTCPLCKDSEWSSRSVLAGSRSIQGEQSVLVGL